MSTVGACAQRSRLDAGSCCSICKAHLRLFLLDRHVAGNAHSPPGLLTSGGPVQQCISAVEYCHARNVAHRDLKLDNTLLDENTPPHVKICDFGFAKLMGDNSKMTTGLGTAVYMAPQQIQKQQGKGYDGRAAGTRRTGGLACIHSRALAHCVCFCRLLCCRHKCLSLPGTCPHLHAVCRCVCNHQQTTDIPSCCNYGTVDAPTLCRGS